MRGCIGDAAAGRGVEDPVLNPEANLPDAGAAPSGAPGFFVASERDGCGRDGAEDHE